MNDEQGKNPTIVDKTAVLDVAARRIVWSVRIICCTFDCIRVIPSSALSLSVVTRGRCVNAGQICLAPDYVLVHKDVSYR
jgi:acyl-CoA reductase-like NAD-dependent aldehyde dehydrogenase